MLGVPLHHPLTGRLIAVVAAAGHELTHSHPLELLKRVAQHIARQLHHEELVRRVALLDAYHHFLLQHPQDIVLAIDQQGHVCGASSTLTHFLDAPQGILGRSLLRVPGLHVTGIRHFTRQEDAQPYEFSVALPEKELSLRATAIPVRGEKQFVGMLVTFPSRSSPRSKKAAPTSLWRASYTFADLRGDTSAFRQCLLSARQAASHDVPILLLGESGTGKELLAHAIHAASPRCHGPFVTVNCGVASDDLLAAEMFGSTEGAFTGAVKGGRKGKLELAHGGTLFLDEVEAMSPKLQVSLLRVLEEGQITRVGGEFPMAVDVRVIAASNEDLKTAVNQKRFRLDLYHRLAVFPITLPPLRERQGDIPLLIRHGLDKLGFSHVRFTADALSLLCRYAWPGNVRELKNVLLRTVYQAQGVTITPADIPQDISETGTERTAAPAGSLQDIEREEIVRMLADTHGNRTSAATRLGIHRATLHRKLKKYGISRIK